jgi:phage terminase large subunit
MYQITTATRKIHNLKKRIRAIQGGTSAGKTIGVLEVLIDLAQRDETPTITSIVSESFPHLKRGAMLDFLNIMQQHRYFQDKRWNKTDYTYTFETGSKIEFFSVDQPGKVRGPRRDRLFVNEANNIPYETFDQLEVRTKDFIIMDWNPVSEFWYYDKVANRDDCEHIILTYKDNEALDERIIASIEQRKDRKGWWQVYGEGQLGEVEGKIYKDWQIIDELPFNARLERRGLDFGYTNDPTTIVDIYYYDGGYIIDELCFQRGMQNKQIADTIKNAISPETLVIADSAEPKSIDDIKSYGINILPTEKGADSVRNGISLVQEQRISVTKRSINVIKEYRNYLFIVDKDGKVTNEPEHEYSHSMDAIRYALTSILKKPVIKQFVQSAPVDNYYGDNEMPF